MEFYKEHGLYNYGSVSVYVKALRELKKLHDKGERVVMYPPAMNVFKSSIGRVRTDLAQACWIVSQMKNRKIFKNLKGADKKALKKSNKYVNTYRALDDIVELVTMPEHENLLPYCSGRADACERIYKALVLTGYEDLALLSKHLTEVFELYDVSGIKADFYLCWEKRNVSNMRFCRPRFDGKGTVYKFIGVA